ncbi:putative disease resistance protein RGA1 isoform X2 [Beta vulgaris subsp. vulgaris]|uniref:putative disease resistance protein RGA1 isoform X2 n=1 Tax=Beta vulgaris subsp. vulgaris TaxID=3555 RepID=UPI002036B165|nr:putative disease resistance protein RGA1 isoform X2 [Beta vulgaris subsp. vulgaris]
MDTVTNLYRRAKNLFDGVDSYLVGNDQRRLLMSRLKKIKLMLSSASDQLNEMGGLGAFDKELEIKLKYGLNRVEFLIFETWRFQSSGQGTTKPCCDINSLFSHLLVIGGCNKNKRYLRKLAKDVLLTLPSFANPVNEGRSFVKEAAIIFERNSEREYIKSLLLQEQDPDLAGVSVVPILGMAGAGKTCLTRFVFNDRRVQDHFELKLWLDISGLSNSVELLFKVVENFKIDLTLTTYTHLTHQDLLKTFLDGKQYLIVLENLSVVSSKKQESKKTKTKTKKEKGNGGEWFDMLSNLLDASANCKSGSKILITSRSTSLKHRAFRRLPMAKGAPYLLESLSQNESMALFKNIAFKKIAEEDRNPRLIDISTEIFNKCANNLHVVTIVASILSSEFTNLETWQYVNAMLASIENPVESIQLVVDEIQKVNRDKLLTHTSLFPLGYKFSKADLQPLWDHLGSHGVNTTEEFEKEFEKLVVMGYFFEDRETDKTGDRVYYKAHILMHEVVKYLSRDGYCLLDKPTKAVEADIIRHASFIVDSTWEVPSWLQCAEQLNSLSFLPKESCESVSIGNIDEIFAKLKALRALDLVMVHFKSSPDFIGELKQLVYLRLGISLESFPKCILNLKNLQTLDLRHTAIKKLPENFCELRHLGYLYTGCRLIDLPPSFEELASLQNLDEFIVGENNGLDALAELKFLVGKLKIRYQEGREKHTELVNAKFLATNNLEDLSLSWSSRKEKSIEDVHQKRDAMEFEFLRPPSTLKSFVVKGWKGVNFPKWAMDRFAILLKNLVSLNIADCHNCQHLPSFNSLRALRSLQLWGLTALKWIEICVDDGNVSASKTAYFPSLKYLMLVNLPKLKGWSNMQKRDVKRRQEKHEKHRYVPQQILKCLFELKVSGCPKLMSMPLVPSLETLEAVNIHEKLLKHLLNAHESAESSSDSSASPTLRELHINSVHKLVSLSITISCLQVLTIRECKELTSLLVESPNSLKRLKIQACPSLKNILGALHNLNVLEELKVESCENLSWGGKIEDADGSGDDSERAAWQGLKSLLSFTLTNISKPEPLPRGLSYVRTLKELSLCWLYNLSVLPKSIEQLTQLNRLVIQCCPKVGKIPEFFPNLKSLNQLEIRGCTKLQRRCNQPDGEDCYLIEHISDIDLGELPKPRSS